MKPGHILKCLLQNPLIPHHSYFQYQHLHMPLIHPAKCRFSWQWLLPSPYGHR
ncbi:hypothetical protein EVA_06172 [gut metagenome]|uniref:Uncharacterized protein n=1 Tax=gut metagenome TaxID=749906 RepID=J9GFK4_9ZZZZ